MADQGILPPRIRVNYIFQNERPTIYRPILDAIAIGEAYQIRKLNNAGTYTGFLTTYAYPDLISTSILDLASVSAHIEGVAGTIPIDVAPNLVTGTDGYTNSADVNVFRTDVPNAFATLAGDGTEVLEVLTGPNAGIYKILSKTATTVTLAETLGLNQTDLNFKVFGPGYLVRTYGVVVGPGYDNGNILVSYTAKRTDLGLKPFTYANQDDLEAIFKQEEIIPENPLAFACQLIIANAGPVEARGLGINEDTLPEHEGAISILEVEPNSYSIVPCTQEPAYLMAYREHVEDSSSPEGRNERILWGSHKLITRDTLVASVGTDGTVSDTIVPGQNDVFVAASGDFVDDGALPNMFLYDLTHDKSYVILSVTNGTTLRLSTFPTTALADIQWEIVIDFFDRSEEAANIRARGAAYASRRVRMIWPPECEIVDGQGGFKDYPSYYIGACYAGQLSSSPPQTPFSKRPVAGISGLKRSNKYFSQAQLNQIAAGGNWIMVQEAEGAPVQCRHQLTTDVTSQERREASLTHDADFIGKTWRLTLDPLTGRNNINRDLMLRLNIACNALIAEDISAGRLREGSKLISISEDPNDSTKVNFYVAANLPKPFNLGDVFILVI